MEYILKLDNFEGPFDLLLHLVKEEKMDLFSIKLETIIDKYLFHIKENEKLDLEIESSYLLVAATLLEIKSKMLLPNYDKSEELEEEKEEIIQKIINYDKYKKLVALLQEQEQERRKVFIKDSEKIEMEYIEPNSIDIEYLNTLYKALLKEQDVVEIPKEITLKKETIVDKINVIWKRFGENRNMFFKELYEKGDVKNQVLSFLAILELARRGMIIIYQENYLEDIKCERIV